MAEPFLGEIRIFGGNFAPLNWAKCDGSTLPISQNDALFALIGTTYGGDGVNTFSLPDLRGRVPVHPSAALIIGAVIGTERVTLTTGQMPSHTHPVLAQSSAGDQSNPGNGTPASSSLVQFSASAPDSTMNPAAMPVAGQNQSHENMMPFLALTYIIALAGIFPSQN